MALADDLISYWSLDEASGTRVDSHGSNDLTDNNTVASATGIIGNCGDFESTASEYLSKSSFSSFPSTAATWSWWMRLESRANDRSVLSKWSASGTQNTFIIEMDSTTGQIFIANALTDGGNNRGAIPSGWSLATWYHCVVVFDGTQTGNSNRLRMWRDDTELTLTYTGTIPASLTSSTADFEVGGCSGLSRYHDGLMDEVGFWGRALTTAEITELYNAGAGRDYSYISASASNHNSLLLLGVG